MSTSTYNVVGMTCAHCVMSVSEEVNQISGVQDVSVELATGELTITSDGDVDPTKVREAVEEAGYQLATS